VLKVATFASAQALKDMHHFNILPYIYSLGLFYMTTYINQYQKGKIILDFTEARDDGVFSCMALCRMLMWNLTATKKVFSSAADCDMLYVFVIHLNLRQGG